MKRLNYRPGNMLTGIFLVYTALLILGLVFLGPSEASGADKIVSEGYEGSERFKATEEPVKPNSSTTVTRGWKGDARIKFHTIRRNEYNPKESSDWIDDYYIHEDKRSPSNELSD